MVGQIRTVGDCVRVGGTVYNNLKGGGGTEKRGEKTQILKRAGKLNQGVGALKKGGWNPYQLCPLAS